MILEAGKPWREADADVAEAIDFFEYYAREMLRLGTPRRMGHVPGEDNVYFYEPRGVAARHRARGTSRWPSCRHDQRRPRRRQHGDHEAGRARPRSSPRSWSRILEAAGAPPGVVNFLPGPAARSGDSSSATPASPSSPSPAPWTSACASSAGRRSTPADDASSGSSPRWAARTPSSSTRRRPGRGRRGVVVSRLRLRRAEVLGLLAGHRARGGLRRVPAPAGRGDAQPRASARPRTRRRASARSSTPTRRDKIEGYVEQGKQRGDARRRRRAARGRLARRRLLRRPARLRRRAARRASSPRRRSSARCWPS